MRRGFDRVSRGKYTRGAATAGSTFERTYRFESTGALKSINDGFFAESLTYTSGGYAGAGYYSGLISSAQTSYKWSGAPSSYTFRYQYDKLGRLEIAQNSANAAWSTGLNGTTPDPVTYDANGNILRHRDGTNLRQYVYNPGTNRLRNTVGSSANHLTYDALGNIIVSATRGVNETTYDVFTNLPTFMQHQTYASSYTYGSQNQRVLQTVEDIDLFMDNLDVYYVHGLSDYPLYEREHRPSGLTEIFFVHGPTGLIATRQGTGTWNYVLKDHLGSTRVVVNESGTVQSYYDYNAFGRVVRQGAPGLRYQFTGQERDPSGLDNFRARLYDDQIGRFWGADPAGQFHSPYVYAYNNPLSYTDPDGEFAFLVVPAIAAAVGGGMNLWSNWDKVTDFTTGVAYFTSGAAGGLVSTVNPLLGGTVTASANISIDIATGNLPDFSNPVETVLYAGKTALDGFAVAGAGPLAKGIGGRLNPRWVQRGSYTISGHWLPDEATRLANNLAEGITAYGDLTLTGFNLTSAAGRSGAVVMTQQVTKGGASLGAGRTGVKQWLQNVGNLERRQLIADIEGAGFKKVFDGKGMMHFERGGMRIRLDPPQGPTPFNHMHLNYGGNKNSYDIFLNRTNYRSPAAHIRIR